MKTFPPLLCQDLDHLLTETMRLPTIGAHFWEPLCGKRLLLTGATGFFGKWLLESFLHLNQELELGATCVGVSRNPELFLATMPHLRNQPSLEWVTLDLASPTDALRKIEPCHYLLHAGSSSSIPVPPLELFETIVGGTRHLLERARSWHDVRVFQKFLFISSGAVYGRLPAKREQKISEEHSTAPSTTSSHHSYGEGKRAAEMLCTLYRETYQLSTVVARCFAFSGPHLPLEGHYAIGNFLRDALAGKSPQLESAGTSRRSYLYGADLMVALWTLLLHGKSNYPYHVGSQEGMTLQELAEKIRLLFQLPDPIVLGESLGGNSYVPETLHIKEDFGVEQRISLEEGLQRHVVWLNTFMKKTVLLEKIE